MVAIQSRKLPGMSFQDCDWVGFIPRVRSVISAPYFPASIPSLNLNSLVPSLVQYHLSKRISIHQHTYCRSSWTERMDQNDDYSIDSRQKRGLVILYCCGVLSTVFTGLRVLARRMSGSRLWWDDYIAIVSGVCCYRRWTGDKLICF